ncbi:MAG: hypothetical protein J6W52_06215 [Bacteroidaceae bacterium]|nr:hypothetical protein [Bacteroidaceae bacterium]
MEEHILNNEALQYLDEAMFTSSLISKKERKKGETDWDNVYPRKKSETMKMAALLAKADEVVEEPNDTEYRERYDTLKEIVEWSQKRHRTWMWSLIAGALLGAGIFYYYFNDQKEDIARAKAEREQVEQWKEIKVQQTTWNACPSEHANDAYTMRLSSAQHYKTYKLIDYKRYAESSQKRSKEWLQRADTAKLQENKEKYLHNVKVEEEHAAKYRADYDSINAMDFAQVHAMAKGDLTKSVERQVSWGKTLQGYMIYLLILIPLYIITGYPHGYTITRHTRRTGCLNIFRKVGFAIASFCFGAGLALSLLPDYQVKTYYSNGSTSTHTEGNSLNIAIIAMKIGLMIVGAFIFCFVASTVMTIETISGLYNNFNWSGWFRKVKPAKQTQNENVENSI